MRWWKLKVQTIRCTSPITYIPKRIAECVDWLYSHITDEQQWVQSSHHVIRNVTLLIQYVLSKIASPASKQLRNNTPIFCNRPKWIFFESQLTTQRLWRDWLAFTVNSQIASSILKCKAINYRPILMPTTETSKPLRKNGFKHYFVIKVIVLLL